MTHRKGYLSVCIAFLELGSTFCGIIMCCCGFMGGLMCLPIFDLLGSSLAGKGYLCVTFLNSGRDYVLGGGNAFVCHYLYALYSQG